MIHAVTDGAGLPWYVQETILFIFQNVDAVCLREKQLSVKELSVKVAELIQQGVPPEKLILHSAPELAHFLPVRGVHFTEFDNRLAPFKKANSDKLAGQSVHSAASAQKAEADGADYLYFGHVFATKSKKDLPGRGLAALSEVAGAVSIPVIAIGGIHEGNISSVRRAGASGSAMISAFFK
ncbi:thiamine phosphate synthase [Domibacillus tundrae]|uniref:thiamine phosphate synthase n=1 Tax=Domibacillus tundrae TaxID=1587527 RepID=UPI0006979966|nr:thiamine phosphate synthase [Domibacillus tundrae]